jgi:peptidoglycan/xylan/chitin deacetylase (PgdA/CDA1 family)
MNKIINFHDVHDAEWFEQVLLIIKKRFHLVPIADVDDYYHQEKNLRNSCHITVDDGDVTFYKIIYPILKKHQVPATLFVSPEANSEQKNFWFQELSDYNMPELRKITAEYMNIDESIFSGCPTVHILKNLKISEIWEIINIYRNKFGIKVKDCRNMSVEQLLEIDRDGLVVLGAHTMSHPILSNESEMDSKRQIEDSINNLRDILGHDVKYFAFPNGVPCLDFGDREFDVLKSSNCRLAFSTEPQNFSLRNNSLNIPRFGISHGNKYFVYAKLYLGSYWNKLREFKTKGERKSRTELKEIMKSAKN